MMALELCEAHQDVQRKLPDGGRCREVLGDAYKGNLVSLKKLHQLRKVEQGAREPIYFVCDDHIYFAGPDVAEHSLQRRSLGVRAGETAVRVNIR